MFTVQDEVHNIFKHSEENSDRTVCIILSSMLERFLEILILSRIGVSDTAKSALLFENDGALSSFFGNIDLAFALGLLDEHVRDDCHTLRRIRNTFAHAALPIIFDTPEIMAEIARFQHDQYISPGELVPPEPGERHRTEGYNKFVYAWNAISFQLLKTGRKMAEIQFSFLEIVKLYKNVKTNAP
jgi:hypothetical protein